MNNGKDEPMRDLLGDGPQKEIFTSRGLRIINQMQNSAEKVGVSVEVSVSYKPTATNYKGIKQQRK